MIGHLGIECNSSGIRHLSIGNQGEFTKTMICGNYSVIRRSVVIGDNSEISGNSGKICEQVLKEF